MTTTSPQCSPFVGLCAAALDAITAKSNAAVMRFDMRVFFPPLLSQLVDFGGCARAHADSREPLERLSAKCKEQSWRQHRIQKRGAKQPAENDDGHGVKNFSAWLAGAA